MEKTISLCMIVKDEESFIEKCLESVQGVVNEIIIVDTGSRDSTVNIAKKYEAKVFEYNWINDFSAARNYALEQASCDYILILDADEFLDEDVSFRHELTLNKDYYINRIKNYSSEGFVRFHEAVRLFKNKIGLKYFGSIHEHLNIQSEGKSYSFAYAKGIIHHVGYLNEVVSSKNKIKRNLDLLLTEVKKNPSGYNFFNLAKQYKQMGETIKALERFKNSYYLSKSSNYLNELIFHMADCLRLLKRYEDGIKIAEDGLVLYPNYTDLHYIKAKLLDEYGLLKESEISYFKCIDLGESDHTTTEGVGSYLAYYNLARVYYRLMEKVKCVEALFKAINLKKDFSAALLMYLKVLTESNIPLNELEIFLKNLFPIGETKGKRSLVNSLYSLRHPLLKQIIEENHLVVQENVLIVAEQYSYEYSNAREMWVSYRDIQNENIKDIVLLSILMSDQELLNKYKDKINLNKKEWNLLKTMVAGEYPPDKDVVLSSYFEELIVFICQQLIILKEYEKFSFLSNWVFLASTKIQYKIAATLKNFGFYDAALDLISVNLSNYPNDHEYLELFGDIQYLSNNFEDSLRFYVQSLKTYDNLLVYRKMHKISKIKNDSYGMENIKREARNITNFFA